MQNGDSVLSITLYLIDIL